MKKKFNNQATSNPSIEISDSKFSDNFKTLLVSLNMAFEAAKAGKSGKELYLISEALKEQSSYPKQ
jgi:hypothetical protein